MAASLHADLCVTALNRALAHRSITLDLVHHSDCGVQYAAWVYVETLNRHGVRISMSRKGNPYDNAKAERFFKTLKEEEVHLMDYEDEAEARQRLPKFIEDLYNRKRLHSALGYLTPVEFEQTCLQPVPP